jgi:hypothetical protein
LQEQEGALVEGRSQDDENGAVQEDNIGDVDTEEEEEGAVTVLKLSNGIMFRVPVEVQGMQLQAVVEGPRRSLLRIDVSLGLLGMGRQYTHSSAFPFLLCS